VTDGNKVDRGEAAGEGSDVPAKFDYLIDRTRTDGIRFGIMQGNHSVLLFDQAKP
jgi:hypothetical protein